jgi:hypothetical protein
MAAAVAPAGAIIIVTPGDNNDPISISPAFGAALGTVTTQYSHMGLIFSDRGAAGPAVSTAVFNDPPLAWAGINPSGDVDLVSPVDVKFVLPNTSTAAVTDWLEVEAGFAADGALTLYAYDITGALLGTATNGAPLGPNGRTTMSVSFAGIASFRVDGADAYGVNQIAFNDLTPAGPSNPGNQVPEPGSVALLIGGATAGLAVIRRRK